MMNRNFFAEFGFRYFQDEDMKEIIEVVLRSVIKTDDKKDVPDIEFIGCESCKTIHNHKRIEAAIRGLKSLQKEMGQPGTCDMTEAKKRINKIEDDLGFDNKDSEETRDGLEDLR
jgi:hypothetical protein